VTPGNPKQTAFGDLLCSSPLPKSVFFCAKIFVTTSMRKNVEKVQCIEKKKKVQNFSTTGPDK